MLHSTPIDNSPRAKLEARLFNEVHSAEAFMAGIKVALLFERPVSVRRQPNGPVQLYWHEGGRSVRARVSYDELVRLAPVAPEGGVILLARSGLPEGVEAALVHLGLQREIRGQVNGFWYDTLGEIPPRMPTAFPTGAVLPQHGLTIGDGSACLALVSVDYVWYPLSEAAAWSYSHAARLHRAEAAVFVPLATSVRSWPYALSATLGDPLQKEQVRTVYGEEAFDRARSDFPTVQVTLRSVS